MIAGPLHHQPRHLEDHIHAARMRPSQPVYESDTLFALERDPPR